MTDTTSMPVYKHQVIKNVLRILARVAFSLTWSIYYVLQHSRRRQARLKAGEQRTLLLANGKFQFETSRPQPPLDTYRIIYVPYHADREGLPLNTARQANTAAHFLASGLGLAEAAPRIGSPNTQLPSGRRPATSSRLGVGITGGPETEVGAYGEACRLLGEAAQAPCQDGPPHGQFYLSRNY
jgi:hypothetical protein